MYMNVNGSLAAQRPGGGLAGIPGGAPGRARGARRPRQARLGRGSVSLAGKGFPARAPGAHGFPGGRGPLFAAPGAPGRFMAARRRWTGRRAHACCRDSGMIRSIVPGFLRIYVS
jgi:hypothetical protein